MGTRYIHTSRPFYIGSEEEKQKCKEVYDDVRQKIFNNQDSPDLQIITFEHFSCVVFCSKLMHNACPDYLYELDVAEHWSWITDEGNGGFYS